MTFIIFIIVLSILVFVHELGHFIMARRAGMKVEEFGFGFPPKIFGIKRGETEYTINAIPFGGFVKIFGEDGDQRDNERSFTGASFIQKLLVIFAGVFMNMLLAFVLLWVVNIMGIRVAIDANDQVQLTKLQDQKVQIVKVAQDSPAQIAKLEIFDELKSIKIKGDSSVVNIRNPQDIQDFVKNNPGKEVEVGVIRGKDNLTINLLPRTNPPEGEGSIGIQMAHTGVAKFPVHIALWRAVLYTYSLTVQTIFGYYDFFAGLLTRGSISSDVAGPIGIAVATKKASDVGLVYLMQFMAVISINLAVLNSIPFPALDGGRGMFIIIEKLRGRPLSKKIEGYIYSGSFGLLLLLMIYITFKDIAKFL